LKIEDRLNPAIHYRCHSEERRDEESAFVFAVKGFAAITLAKQKADPSPAAQDDNLRPLQMTLSLVRTARFQR
jgi:hypothetical protein